MIAGRDLAAPGSSSRAAASATAPSCACPRAATPRPSATGSRRGCPPGQRVTTYGQAQPGLRRFWDQLTMYLGLTGLVALIVGGIGVGGERERLRRQKLATIAILKASARRGARCSPRTCCRPPCSGWAAACSARSWAARSSRCSRPRSRACCRSRWTLPFSPARSCAASRWASGVTLLYALWPLLQIRHVPPALILRRDVEPRAARPPALAAALPIAAGLAALALWQAGSLEDRRSLRRRLAAALLLLASAPAASPLRWRAPRAALAALSPAWRQGAGEPPPPGQPRGSVLVSLGLAVMLVVSVALLDRSLRAQLVGTAPPSSAPAFFFIDIQTDQAEPFARLVAASGGDRARELIPVVRSRLAAVNGALDRAGPRRARRAVGVLTREYVLTWAAEPPGRNTVVAGRWWTPEEAAPRAPDLGRGGDRHASSGWGSATRSPSTSRACR